MLTSDTHILTDVMGSKIELEQEPVQLEIPEPYYFKPAKKQKVQAEIDKLISKGVIEITAPEPGQFVSNIFTKEKPDGTLRIILDLSDFNDFVVYRHFKMDSLQTAINLMSESCLMASIDWKDAYYSVPVATKFRKYLCFYWQGILYRYTCFANGLAPAPRKFTKLTKVIFSELRKMGHLNTHYIDDTLLIAMSIELCRENVRDTVRMSEEAGFVVHPIKSVLHPTQRIVYLGFWLNSVDMTVTLTETKATKLKTACLKLLEKQTVPIRELAHVIGLMVASFHGVQYGQLFYRSCDNHKTHALKLALGNYENLTILPPECKEDLEWWERNIETQTKKILVPKPSYELESDASLKGWGGCIKTPEGKSSTGGNWSETERNKHINELELIAAWFTIKCFCGNATNACIKVFSDNTTTVAYLNHMGGTKTLCNQIAREVWLWCYQNNNCIIATHLPGVLNLVADKESRSIHDNMEWRLNPELFDKITKQWGTPDIDLFASRLNFQVPKYFSWKPDPGALAVDAFMESWSDYYFYAFPPFNMIGKLLKKIEIDRATGIIVVPYWPTQSWFSKFTQMCINTPNILFSRRPGSTLTHPWRQVQELPKTRMLAALVSGQRSHHSEWMTSPRASSWHLGDREQENSTTLTWDNGISFVIKGVRTRCLPL